MDADHLRSVLPHYVAILLLSLLVLGGARATLGEPTIWIQLAVVIVVVVAYRVVLGRLGYLPDAWERPRR
jgi:hypothetical protein